MDIKEIAARLKTLGLPVALDCFLSSVKPPYLVYQVSEYNSGADGINLIKELFVRLELYEEIRDRELKEKIERLFTDEELSVNVVFIDDEKMFETIFEFDTICKLAKQGG